MKALMVGTWADTNGQKARYVEAARRWGSDPDVLKALIVGGRDLAGVAGRYAAASDKAEGLVIRSAHVAGSRYAYFDFPGDIHWTRQTNSEVRELAREADVIHLTNETHSYVRLRVVGKPAVLHHHGTLLRNYPERVLPHAKRFGLLNAVSTHDLLRHAPDAHWLPTAYDIDALAAIRKEHRRKPDGLVRIMSAPTNRAIKSTDLLEQAVQTLKAEGLPVELVTIEGKKWAECLRVKATADIYFDQVKLGYGCNAIEAWGMGIPVIAGADEWTLNAMHSDFGELPFYTATEATITDALRQMVTDKTLRTQYATLGRKHAERFHAEKPALLRLVELYHLALAMRRDTPAVTEEFPLGPGTFRTSLDRLRVRVGNQEYAFTNGMLHIDNPHMGQRMRRMAHHQRRLQITEDVA